MTRHPLSMSRALLCALALLCFTTAAHAQFRAGVQGTVTLSEKLKDRAAPEDTVFVFARAADGPPMPLAVARVRVRELPYRFRLDDSMAMTPAMKISSFSKVIVTARVSKSGSATAGRERAGRERCEGRCRCNRQLGPLEFRPWEITAGEKDGRDQRTPQNSPQSRFGDAEARHP